MSVQQAPSHRRPPTESEQARRRLLLQWTKWMLPVGALVLLGSIAAWPEIDRSLNASRVAYRQVAAIRLDSGSMLGPRYRGLDAHGRPYMITAETARQVGPERINLDHPIADTLSQGGTWLQISARKGVYMQHSELLDLSGHVTFYRDDGTIMTSPTAGIDVRRGIILSDDWVHAEGPFGVLDAQGTLMSQRDGIVQFRGPGRMILNDDRAARPATPPATTSQGHS
ncbi:LPS export ABC transporter periplasmic protein LptC [Lichenicoccus roseus]|uniref:LPS export ABC transporter periplasmic protein LptC n=2 Tax=Lichenicoccus roseus TaxID=2683649 RepID=A0A5R9J5B3_9PROT|nr:LPS export ABC transporter periplasmic protein LptC [Lichenicoccus roseus]